MVDADMVKEVKDLIAEGYTPEKVKANLVKIGFSDKEAGELLAEASAGAPAPPEPVAKPVGTKAAQPPPKPVSQPTPEPAAQPMANEGLEGLSFEEEPGSEDDLLLAAGGDAGPAELPEVEHPPGAPATEAPAAPPKHAHERRHHRPAKPAEPKPKPPEGMAAPEEKPKSGAGKAIIIFLLAFIVILVLAYFLAFPKLGITLF